MIYPTRFLHILFMLLVLAYGCKKEVDDPRNFPRVELSEEVIQDSTGVTFTADVERSYGEIIERGFVWFTSEGASIDDSRIIVGNESGSLKYKATARTDLFKGNTYYARAFVRTNDYLVYSNEVEFISEYHKPYIQLERFSPSEAMWNDTLVISGSNFSFLPVKTRVMFGTERAELIHCVDTAITIRVPHVEDINSVPVFVKVYSDTASFSEPFRYVYPQVLDFFPKQGVFLDTLTIEGRDIPPLLTDIEVRAAGFECPVVDVNDREIKVLISTELDTSSAEIQVKMYGKTSIMEGRFTLLPAEILEITPNVVKMPGIIVNIRGENFSPSPLNNQVSFDGLGAEVLSASRESLDVLIPMGLVPDPIQDISKDITVMVSTANQPAVASASIRLEYINSWSELGNQPSGQRFFPLVTSYKGKVYYGMGSLSLEGGHLKDMYEYDPALDTWTGKGGFPGDYTGFPTSFRIGNVLYVCCGTRGERMPRSGHLDTKKVWAYDLDTGEWSPKADFPGSARSSAFGFAANEEGFMGGGEYGGKALFDFWKYNPLADTWTRLEDINKVKSSVYFVPPFAQGDSKYGYVLGNYRSLPHRQFWRYDPLADEWLELAPLPFPDDEVVGFYLNGYIYAGDISESGSRFFRYNIASDNWEPYIYGGQLRTGAVGIDVHDKGYLIGGKNTNSSLISDVWVLDPVNLD